MEALTSPLEQLELTQYFEWVNGGIRIVGTRIGLEQIVDAYEAGATPEEIASRYRALSLEEIYASITYYLANQSQIKLYMQQLQREDEAEWKQSGRESLTEILKKRERDAQYQALIDAAQNSD